jgi:hypothetical protein
MRYNVHGITVGILLCVGSAWAQPASRAPHIGYVYPAGGQRGTTITVMVGGQNLRGARQAVVSGAGVSVEVGRFCPSLANLGADEREEIQRRFRQAFAAGIGDPTGKPLAPPRDNPPDKPKGPDSDASTKPKTDSAAPVSPTAVKIPPHPMLEDLDKKSPRELIHLRMTLFPDRSKLQMNRQLSESVLITVTLAPDAEPGNRELRIQTATGLSNPVVFQVGTLPEIREMEPNGGESLQGFPELSKLPNFAKWTRIETLKLPVLLNGQIMPGDVDRFRFSAEKDQQIVVEARARGLMPYLADAVPGWFQATLTLYDSTGKEVAFVDDYRFHPDPTMMVTIPRTGDYDLEIRDAIYRGREDFVYRVSVGPQPYITQAFPLGGRAGQPATAAVEGWNLASKQLPLDTTAAGPHIRRAVLNEKGTPSNSILYAVDDMPECTEVESNDTLADAQPVRLPVIINGRIDKDGDEDTYRVELSAGQDIVAEVYGRRLDSPIDSLLRLMDEKGKTLALNDDFIVKENNLYLDAQGLITHPADSLLTAKVPKGGVYYVQISDTQGHGSPAHSYQLRISAPRPGFDLRMTPSSLSMRSGIPVPVTVYVLRYDGFGGPIEVTVKTPSGFRLDGGRIPAGVDRIRMTLAATAEAPSGVASLKLEGQAQIGEKAVRSPVVGAEDMMQAFLYRHLVPSQELMVSVDKPQWSPLIEPAGQYPIRIPAGGQAEAIFKTPRRPAALKFQMELLDPPAGITLGPVSASAGQLSVIIKADKEKPKIGYEDNLIVELVAERAINGKDGKPTGKTERFSVGGLPAIPLKIVEATAAEPATPAETVKTTEPEPAKAEPAVSGNPTQPKPKQAKGRAKKPQ